MKPLAMACEIKPPKSEARRKLSDSDLVSFLPMEDLGIDQKLAKPERTKRLGDVVGSYTYFAEGDVLLAKITPCFENGKLGIASQLKNGVGFGSTEYFVFRPDRAIERDWLYYFLSREVFREEGAARMSGAVGHKRVSKEFIEDYAIPVPPLSEQKRIVGVLDEACAGLATAKANAEKNLHNARALLDGHLQFLFGKPGPGWSESIVGKHIRFIDYRGKTPVKTPAGIRLITAKNVKMGYLSKEPTEFVAPESYTTWMTRGIPQEGDVLFTTEAPLANVAQLDTDEKVAFAQRVIIMQPDRTKLDSSFLKYLLLSQPIQQRIRAAGTGATVHGIKASLLRQIRISFPAALTVQRQHVRKLDVLATEVDRLASLCERKLAALDALKESLLHQAFTGQL